MLMNNNRFDVLIRQDEEQLIRALYTYNLCKGLIDVLVTTFPHQCIKLTIGSAWYEDRCQRTGTGTAILLYQMHTGIDSILVCELKILWILHGGNFAIQVLIIQDLKAVKDGSDFNSSKKFLCSLETSSNSTCTFHIFLNQLYCCHVLRMLSLVVCNRLTS